MSKDKITGSTVLPSQILTQVVGTNEIRMGDERFSTISQDYLSGDHKAVPTSKALFDAFMAISDAVNEIDPDNHFFRDNAVITRPLLTPTFDEPDDWIVSEWELIDNKAVYSNLGAGDNNSLRFHSKAFTSPGHYFFRIEIERIDTGSLELVDFDDQVLATYTKKGVYYLEHYVTDPHIVSFRLISHGLYPNEVVILPYIGLHKVQSRLRDYLEYVLSGTDISGGNGDIAELKEALNALKVHLGLQIEELMDLMSIHVNDTLNPHQLTLAVLQAAHINHTHTPESINAAHKNHIHEPSELGASEVGHTHIPSECGAAPTIHKHIPEDCDAAPSNHKHSDLVSKREHTTDLDLLEQRLIMLIDPDSDEETINGNIRKVEAQPLSIVSVAPNHLGYKHTLMTRTSLGANEIVCETGTPLFTMRTGNVFHTNAGDYDQHSGILSYYHPTINVQDFFLAASANFEKVYPHDIIRTDIINEYIPTLKESGIIPIMKTHGISTTEPLTFQYRFHTSTKLNGLTLMRIVDPRIDDDNAKIMTQGGCLSKAELTIFNSGKQIGSQMINLSISDWKGPSVKIPITITEEADEIVLRIVEVHPLVADAWDEPVWSLKIKPNININDAEVEILDLTEFVGLIDGVKGVTEITIDVPKYTTIPAEMITHPPSPRSYMTLYNATKLSISEGVYDIKAEITPLGIEVTSGMPKGFVNSMKCSSTTNMENIIHPYWGTGSAIFLSNKCTHQPETLGVTTPPKFTFKRPVTLAGLSLSARTKGLTTISVILTNSSNKTTTKVFNLIGNKILSTTSLSTWFDIEFDELYRDLVTVEILVGNQDVDITYLDLRLVGIHYNPNTKELYDYHNKKNIICVVGSIVAVEPIGGNGVKYMATASTHDNSTLGSNTSESATRYSTYILPGIIPSQKIAVNESVELMMGSMIKSPEKINGITIDRGIYQFKADISQDSVMHTTFK